MTAGCQTPAAPFDPFLAGRSTIPPPGTAVPAAGAPYYNAAPPTVTVPAPGATYTAPGAIPATPPAVAVPPAGAGQLPRGISVPQSNREAPRKGAQLAKWESSSASDADSPRRGDGVVRASYEERGPESPIRIVEPAANQKRTAATDEQPAGKTANRSAATAPAPSAVRFRKLPELTDFPPAEGGKP